ncbi:MAG: hypothetical protein G01um101420_292 [Parcubacteria group bacterium Gr01-1014_20]|nr:MAG: hypothetical protein G01um101420_292 [Parcubacteria group bacterium Gr01-1014_20]
MITLLAIMGRGIQKTEGAGGFFGWSLTEDLEVMEEDGAHAVYRKPVDDENVNCMIGGGQLNILAGAELILTYRPRVVVCAYGPRSQYLREVDGRSESEVMSNALLQILPMSGHCPPFLMSRWGSDNDLPGPSNTKTEVGYILDLALNQSNRRVGIVTVGVHLPRVILFAKEHLESERFKDQNLEINFFSSEQVLMESSPAVFAPRVTALHSSRAYRRNAEREARGIEAILSGTYGQGYEAWRPFNGKKG